MEFDYIVRAASARLKFLRSSGVEYVARRQPVIRVVATAGAEHPSVVFVVGAVADSGLEGAASAAVPGPGLFDPEEAALLGKIIEAMGLGKDDVSICTIAATAPGALKAATPKELKTLKESKTLKEFKTLIEKLSPKAVITLGDDASWLLLGRGVKELRGRLHVYENIKVTATHHPRSLLGDPALKRQTWDDMKLVMAEVEGPKGPK